MGRWTNELTTRASERSVRWTDGRTDGQQKEQRTDGPARHVDVRADGQMDERGEERANERTGRWTDGPTDGRKYGWMGR